MTNSRKSAATGRPTAVPQPAFELTADEMAWAVRFFSACRRMSDESRKGCMIFVDVAENAASRVPLHPVAKLRLVGGSTP